MVRLNQQGRNEDGVWVTNLEFFPGCSHLLSSGSQDHPYVIQPGKGGQEGKNITLKLKLSRYRTGFWVRGMKMKGTLWETRRNRAHVKAKLIPLAGHSSVFGPLCGCSSVVGKEATGTGAGGEMHPSLLLRVFNFLETVIKQISTAVWQPSH